VNLEEELHELEAQRQRGLGTTPLQVPFVVSDSREHVTPRGGRLLCRKAAGFPGEVDAYDLDSTTPFLITRTPVVLKSDGQLRVWCSKAVHLTVLGGDLVEIDTADPEEPRIIIIEGVFETAEAEKTTLYPAGNYGTSTTHTSTVVTIRPEERYAQDVAAVLKVAAIVGTPTLNLYQQTLDGEDVKILSAVSITVGTAVYPIMSVGNVLGTSYAAGQTYGRVYAEMVCGAGDSVDVTEAYVDHGSALAVKRHKILGIGYNATRVLIWGAHEISHSTTK
jgi:hypothetical protein